MCVDDLPLFTWHPDGAEIMPFPLRRRRSKVVDIACKLLTKRTEAHVEQYTGQVTDALCRQLGKSGIGADDQAKQIRELSGAQWTLRPRGLRHTGNDPRGAA